MLVNGIDFNRGDVGYVEGYVVINNVAKAIILIDSCLYVCELNWFQAYKQTDWGYES